MSRAPTGFWDPPAKRARRKQAAAAVDQPAPTSGNGADHEAEPIGYGEPDWWQWAQKTRQGNLLNNFNNAKLALESDPQFAGLFAHDEMARQTVTVREVGGHKNPRPAGLLHADHISAVQLALQRLGMRHMGREITVLAIEWVASRSRFHPLRDWLEGLAWDGEGRLNALLPAYFGCDNREPATAEYLARVGPMFLIGLCARVFDPGVQHDYMLVLEGPQGILKSSALRVLGGHWFSDALPDLNGDQIRLSQWLRGKWLIEVAELASFRGAASEHLKSFVTRQIESYIPKFGQGEVARAAAMRVRRHHQSARLPARRDRRAALLAGDVRRHQPRRTARAPGATDRGSRRALPRGRGALARARLGGRPPETQARGAL